MLIMRDSGQMRGKGVRIITRDSGQMRGKGVRIITRDSGQMKGYVRQDNHAGREQMKRCVHQDIRASYESCGRGHAKGGIHCPALLRTSESLIAARRGIASVKEAAHV